MKSSNDYKLSYHIILDNCLPFRSLIDVNHFAWYIIWVIYNESKNGNEIANHFFWQCNDENCYRKRNNKEKYNIDNYCCHCFIDELVYNQWQLFRIYNSCKINTERYL